MLLAATLLLGSGCTTLHYPPPPAPDVRATAPASSGVLARVSSRFAARHPPTQSGFLSLSDNEEAFNFRLALIDEATESIDAQYYIWEDDETGILLFERLLQAADRGVRVRLLVDDLMFAADDRNIAAISRHPNFDIKIFNPGRVRDSTLGALGEFLLYFRELNRRMHNKLLVVDNQMAIVGGRNIGNAYFGLSEKYNFRDLDILVVGPVIEELSHAFDDYWNAELAYPGVAMSGEAMFADIGPLREQLSEHLSESTDVLAAYPLQRQDWTQRLLHLPARLHAGDAHFLQDDPVSFGAESYRLLDMLDYVAAPTENELLLVSPYVIPVSGFLELLSEESSNGVTVKILTASMGSNNHTVAHSHYKKYRRAILATGSELLEFRHDVAADTRDISDVTPVESRFISLHVKAMVADRQRCFVGSLNLDPRAIELNTENGLYIESSELCGELAREFDRMMAPENAWRVYLDEDDRLRWESSAGTVSRQPARSSGQRIADFFFGLLPIESQL